MSHERDLVDSELEEIAEEIWTLSEDGRDHLDELRRISRVSRLDDALRLLGERGLAEVRDERVSLTRSGREMAETQVRRHRLAEMLLSTVLEVEDEQAVNRTACVLEHVLGAAVTDSVCSFLGHPKFCPHGKPIPPGSCCRSFTRSVEPLVQPLDQMAVGQSGRIVYIVPKDPERLGRLSTLGVIPGASIRLQQKRPAAVIRVGETTLAVDSAIASEIYVKKTG